jgi:hypothetical protein
VAQQLCVDLTEAGDFLRKHVMQTFEQKGRCACGEAVVQCHAANPRFDCRNHPGQRRVFHRQLADGHQHKKVVWRHFALALTESGLLRPSGQPPFFSNTAMKSSRYVMTASC